MPSKSKNAPKQSLNVQAAKVAHFPNLKAIPQIAVAVSGGGDSMALLRMLHDDSLEIIAITVDHALRETSIGEAQQVATWCNALGVRHVTLKWHHEKITSGIQAKARKARYDLLSQWCSENKIPVLLTGHNMDDQAETVAMRQRRTTSVKSLSGIWPETEWNGIRIIRPLLDQTRTQLRNYLKSIDQPWIDDPSNSDEKFERIRIRNSHPANSLAEIANASQGKVRLAQQAAANWIGQNSDCSDTKQIAIQRESFCALLPLEKDFVVSKIIASIAKAQTELEARQRLCAWLAQPGFSQRNLGGVIFTKRKLQIIVKPEPERRKPQSKIS
jgi:tRNA(Ile)-lysidine synthase